MGKEGGSDPFLGFIESDKSEASCLDSSPENETAESSSADAKPAVSEAFPETPS